MKARFLVIALAASFAAGWSVVAQPGASPSTPKSSDELDGTWEVVSVIENGKPMPMEIVKQTVLQDGRIVVKGQLMAFPRPDGKVRTLAFVTDAKASPKTIDLAGTVNVGSRGIYMQDGDTLLLCLPGVDGNTRPAAFASLPGSHTILMTMQRVKQAAATPPPAPTPPAPPPAMPAMPAEDTVRRMLAGTWGHQTDEQIMRLTLNPDGSYTAIATYKRGLKKVFDSEDRTSGTWRLKDGDVIFTVSASSIRGSVGQVSSYRITSITNSEVLYVNNQTGQRRIEWKIR